jgi:glycosyltransferase involved in cell wall biosynthesis
VTRPGLPQSIAIVTDAWHPQTNGVVRTLSTTCELLRQWGHDVTVISPDQYWSVPAPTYPEIRLALTLPGAAGRALAKTRPDAVHIATEGPLGFAARRYCMNRKVPFTTAYHTQFPDYFARRTGLSPKWFWPYIRRFHRPAQRIMVATETIRAQLREQGLTHLHHWSRGVDLGCFSPDAPRPREYDGLEGPILLYVGRVAVEKNIEAFLVLAPTPAPRLSSATARRAPRSKRSFPRRISSANARVLISLDATPMPTPLSFRARPTRSGSS